MNTNGILIIDKPSGWTSHDVVAKLRGVLKQKRIGHGGTLDPMATGVLPVFAGRATRAAQFAENADKEYIAGLRFGIVTDTQDITGKTLKQQNVDVSIDELETVLPFFLGKQKQIPPMYSAIKKDGKKLYELARKGIETDRKPREIEILSIAGINTPQGENEQDLYIKVSCSKGTYVRTLCHDIGQIIGCGAALSYLRRTRAGMFTIDKAHKLNDIVAVFDSSYVSNTPLNVPFIKDDLLLPVDSIFLQYSEITLNDTDTQKVKNGAFQRLRCNVNDGKYRVYSEKKEFLLLGEVINGNMKMIKSFYETEV